MSVRFFLLLAFALLSPRTVSTQTVQQGSLRTYENSDAYIVYNELLTTKFTSLLSDGKPLVISAETVPFGMCLKPDDDSKSLTAAIADYRKQNQWQWLLQRKFNREKQYELLPPQEIRARFQKPGDGVNIELSAVGFNPAKTVAVVYAGYRCPGLCGSGTFYVFQKKRGQWLPLDWKGQSCSLAS